MAQCLKQQKLKFDKAQNAGLCPIPWFIFLRAQGIFNIAVIIRLDRIIQSKSFLDSPIKHALDSDRGSWNDNRRNKTKNNNFCSFFNPIEGFQVKRETERKESG
jgi:hypothetical protein